MFRRGVGKKQNCHPLLIPVDITVMRLLWESIEMADGRCPIVGETMELSQLLSESIPCSSSRFTIQPPPTVASSQQSHTRSFRDTLVLKPGGSLLRHSRIISVKCEELVISFRLTGCPYVAFEKYHILAVA